MLNGVSGTYILMLQCRDNIYKISTTASCVCKRNMMLVNRDISAKLIVKHSVMECDFKDISLYISGGSTTIIGCVTDVAIG